MNGYSVLVDTSGLSSMEEILVASVITRRVLETYGQLFLDDRERFAALPPTLVALEDAESEPPRPQLQVEQPAPGQRSTR